MRSRSWAIAGVSMVAAVGVGSSGCSGDPPGEEAATAFSRSVTPKLRPSPAARALSDAFANAAQAIRPSVVRLDVETLGHPPGVGAAGEDEETPLTPDFLPHSFENQKGPRVVLHETGSGVLLDTEGHILTSGHVAHGARKLTIKLADGRAFPGKILGTDPLTDVGVVTFEKTPPGLVAARLGDSDKLRIGEWAIAVGSPLGMDQTVTAGVISGVGQTGNGFRFESGERVRKYIQTDAEINPGNSGGPLVNLEGEVLGLATVISVGPGGSYGFAIPIRQASAVAAALIRGGHLNYPYIGVSVVGLAELPRELLDQIDRRIPGEGALVAATKPGGPAAVAGLEPGDVITRIDGRAVSSASDVIGNVSAQKIGAKLAVDFVRGGASRSLDVTVAEYPMPDRGSDAAGR
jgi:S1-C subfamily serine protease